MANFEIDEEVLVAFLKGELDAAQAAAVEAWYDRSAANRRMLGRCRGVGCLRRQETAALDK